MPSGGEQAIEWIMIIFLAGVLGGALVYTMWSFADAANDANVTAWITSMDTVIDLIPTWIKIIMIMGFTTVIALLGLTIYSVLKSRAGGGGNI